ncbi:hypothetical protein C8R43DRAFT_616906 [Mycena crocata]|nr:hypothetical protein C8R43DRAFT_616906 [Mycena crocata]
MNHPHYCNANVLVLSLIFSASVLALPAPFNFYEATKLSSSETQPSASASEGVASASTVPSTQCGSNSTTGNSGTLSFLFPCPTVFPTERRFPEAFPLSDEILTRKGDSKHTYSAALDGKTARIII